MVYDFVVIGSGFGGSVASLRLAEKDYSVLGLKQDSDKKWDKIDRYFKTVNCT